MHDDRLTRLSDRQRESLRLVFMHMSSKDIARALGISSHTVDQDLKRAMRILEVDSRVEAARLLARLEGFGEYPPLVYQSPDVAATGAAPPSMPPVEREERTGRLEGMAVREDQASFAAPPPPYYGIPRSFLSYWGSGNDLSIRGRLERIGLVAMLTIVTFAILIAGLEGLGRIF